LTKIRYINILLVDVTTLSSYGRSGFRVTISESLEDYLKSVYQIQIEKDFARVKDVVEILGVKTSSVISALKKLSENGLVDYEKYSYIKLTQAGLMQASLLFEKHNSVKTFLEAVLYIESSKADELAHGLEHHLNQELLTKMEAATRFFAENPDLLKKMQTYVDDYEKESQVTLDRQKSGNVYRVEAVRGDPELKRRLLSMGVLPGTEISLEAIAPLGDPIEVKVRGYRLSLRKEEARAIVVERI